MQDCFHEGLYHSKSWSVLSIPNRCMFCCSYYRPFLTGLYDCKDSAKHPLKAQAGNLLLEILKLQLLKRHWSTNTLTHPIVDSMWWLDTPTNIPFELLWIHILTEKSLPKAVGFQHSSHHLTLDVTRHLLRQLVELFVTLGLFLSNKKMDQGVTEMPSADHNMEK